MCPVGKQLSPQRHILCKNEALIKLIKATTVKKTVDWVFRSGCVNFMPSLTSP